MKHRLPDLPRIFLPLAATLMLLNAATAQAQGVPAPQAATAQLDELARDVERVESLRAVKDLQRSYAQYSQFALWDEMAPLFARDARIMWGDKAVTGQKAIAEWLKARVGGAKGLSPGALHSEFIEDEIINLSVDGQSARGRWEMMALTGDGKGKTRIEGGIYENEYVLEDGRWKFSLMRFYPQYEGDYEKGWANIGGKDLPQIPYHFTVDETGVPIPQPAGPAPRTSATLATLESRIDLLNQEDSVRNLQNAYGYYVDRKMWTDVVDLFADDAVVEIAGAGIFKGKDGARRAMELMGAEGLSHGQLNDRPLFGTMVEVLPGGTEAISRGLELGMIGEADKGTASWEFTIFRNRFAREQGLWKIKELRLYPLLKADYGPGWGKGGVARPAEGMLPAFTGPNPVTGREITLAGARIVGQDRLTAAAPPAPAAAPKPAEEDRLFEARRKLRRSAAFDSVENVSHAYGYYLTDFQWMEMASIFAKGGNKHSPFAGFYLGQDRIRAAATAMYGKAPETRPGISYHWRTQPVIHVSHDGRSANLRTRLFQPRTAKPDGDGNSFYSSSLFGGMYPNDQAVNEDGVWRLWSLTIDEPYFTMAGWKGGWSGVKPVESGEGSGASPLVKRLPPDILMTALGRRAEHFRGGTGKTVNWPGILPMWFHYKNPVSGREPEHYWPDSTPSLLLPQSRLIANGYQMPPNGPESDGIGIELTPPAAMEMGGE